jgi:hypothetical protein
VISRFCVQIVASAHLFEQPRNLLFDSDGHLRISDFGLCRRLVAAEGFVTTVTELTL